MAAEKPGSPEIFQRPGMGREPAVTTVPGETGSENNFQVFFCHGKTERFFLLKTFFSASGRYLFVFFLQENLAVIFSFSNLRAMSRSS